MTKDAKNGKTDGHVGRIYARSEPSWPPTPSPGPRVPNVIVMLLDDMGYSDVGCFGSEIPTPNIDRLAERDAQHRLPRVERVGLLDQPHQVTTGRTDGQLAEHRAVGREEQFEVRHAGRHAERDAGRPDADPS